MRKFVMIVWSVAVGAPSGTALISSGRREALAAGASCWHWLLGTGGLGVAPNPQSASVEPYPPSQNWLGGMHRSESEQWRNAPAPSRAGAEFAAVELEVAALELLALDAWLASYKESPYTPESKFNTLEPNDIEIQDGDGSGNRRKFDFEVAARLSSPALLGDSNIYGTWLDMNSTSQVDADRVWPRSGLSAVALTLARADGVPLSVRQDVGWPWGLCGWRHCGPLADAEKALTTLRAQSGMLTPGSDMRFLVDVARRSVDEARGACRAAGLVGGIPPGATVAADAARSTDPGASATRATKIGRESTTSSAKNRDLRVAVAARAYAPLPPEQPYLSLEALNAVLGSDEASATVMVGGSNEAASLAAMEAYEAEMLASFQSRRNQGDHSAPTSDSENVGDGDEESRAISSAQRALALRLRLAF